MANRSHYIDYQDCKYVGGRRMLCSGLNNYRMKADGPAFPLGGLEIVDLKTDQADLPDAGRAVVAGAASR